MSNPFVSKKDIKVDFSYVGDNLISDYNKLIDDFDRSLLGLRQSHNEERTRLSADLKSSLLSGNDQFIKSLGPLNEDSRARIRTSLWGHTAQQLLQYDLGTTENDLNIALGGVLGSIQLGRERNRLEGNLGAIKQKLEFGLNERNKQKESQRFSQGLQGMSLAASLMAGFGAFKAVPTAVA